ncbi:GPW/gp25 family protein [Schinkia azotoformans]|uniref:GPW/gp25 family protein n=1 Tax=Schinkia azotoformans TaxID=1454 RepID=UPI002DB801F6|nr:GPW/gp25 family protein [Schinkia azotoformans]MEC1744110.1 hypothetical protein [Schinkia azotoformans]
MEYIIKPGTNTIDFGATGVQEILQNIGMVLETPAFSCPMNRDFALIPDLIDAPVNIVQAQMRGQLAEAIQKYEPRAELMNIEFQTDELNGRIIPVVRVRIDASSI